MERQKAYTAIVSCRFLHMNWVQKSFIRPITILNTKVNLIRDWYGLIYMFFFYWNAQFLHNARRVSGIIFIKYAHSQKTGKPSNVNVLGTNYTKGLQQDSHNLLWLPMPEGDWQGPVVDRLMLIPIAIACIRTVITVKYLWNSRQPWMSKVLLFNVKSTIFQIY